jgi:predicted SprT family Zn-dependent metalloprotease
MDRKQIIAKVIEVVALANQKFPSAKIAVPTVDFYRKGRAAGQAWQRRHHLAFNEVLAKENPDTFYETVIHEVSHLVVPKTHPYHKQAHGPEFKYVDRVLGGRGTRCHSYDVSSTAVRKTKTRYEVKCSCQSHWVTKKTWQDSKNPNREVKCKVCGSNVKATNNFKKFI